MATSLHLSDHDDHPHALIGDNGLAPWQLSWQAWRQVLANTWKEASEDNIGIVAAGVAFYAFLAIVPLLASVVLIYGLIADAGTVLHDVQALVTVLPAYAAKLIGHQLVEVVDTSTGKKGLGILAALALTLFGARNGAAAVITALNIAYEEEETRNLFRLTFLALFMTIAGVLLAVAAVVAVAALGDVQAIMPKLNGAVMIAGRLASYALLTLGGAAGAATLYRYGPSRPEARWKWLTPGSIASALGWLILTLGLGFFVANVSDYSATYGSLSTVIVLLTWLYLSSYILLLGAELNSEIEKRVTGCSSSNPNAPSLDQGKRSSRRDEAQMDQPADTCEPKRIEHAEPRSVSVEAVTIRSAGAASRLVGLGRVGAIQSFAAAGGLVLIRRRGQALKGGGLLVLAATLAFLSREKSTDESEGT